MEMDRVNTYFDTIYVLTSCGEIPEKIINKLGGNEDVSTWMDRENLYFHDKVILMAFIITEKR